MHISTIVRFLERHYSPQIPAEIFYPAGGQRESVLPDNASIVVVGGGIAGCAFARQLLLHAQMVGKMVRMTMINSTNCNYCGGLVTNLAAQTLNQVFHLDIPADLILRKIDQCIYINKAGSTTVELHSPMTALLRTSRFGIEGFDDSIKDRIIEGLEEPWRSSLVDIEPTIVTRIERLPGPVRRWRVTLSKRNPDHSPVVLEADYLVMAGGLRALDKPMMQEFQHLTGFVPPPVMPASVTEIDTSKAIYNHISNSMMIIDNVIPGAVVAFIPKGEEWLTLTCLGKQLVKEELDVIFNHPEVKKMIDLPHASETPRCHTICKASVFTGPARNFYGDGWVIVGDLTGYGRVLKDGYSAAFFGGCLAAATMVYYGGTRAAFARHYHQPLKAFASDNRTGMRLFTFNTRLQRSVWFPRLLVDAARAENSSQKYGGFIHGSIRALASGELTYRLILLLLMKGMIWFMCLHPVTTFRAFWRNKSL